MEEKKKSDIEKGRKFAFFYIITVILVFLILLGFDFYLYKEKGKSLFLSKIVAKSQDEILFEIMNPVVKSFSPKSIKFEERNGVKLWRFKIHSVSEARAQAFLIYEQIEKNKMKGRMEWDKSRPEVVSLSVFSGNKIIAMIVFEAVSSKETEKGKEKKFDGEVAFIIDDIGYSVELLEEILKIKEPLTLSILPFLPNSIKCAEMAIKSGKEIMIHMPMESNNGNDLEIGIIKEQMREEEIKEGVNRAIEFLPMAKGMNNHKGSKITRNERLMEIILGELKKRNLFFLDSKTSDYSVASRVAKRINLPYAERDIFIDSINSKDIMEKNILKLFKIAKKKGYSIGIAHPYPDTLEVLKEMLPQSERYGVKLVFVSEIIKRK